MVYVITDHVFNKYAKGSIIKKLDDERYLVDILEYNGLPIECRASFTKDEIFNTFEELEESFT